MSWWHTIEAPLWLWFLAGAGATSLLTGILRLTFELYRIARERLPLCWMGLHQSGLMRGSRLSHSHDIVWMPRCRRCGKH